MLKSFVTIFLCCWHVDSIGYLKQFPANGVYKLECESLASSICFDLCSRCTDVYSKPLLEDCIVEHITLLPQGDCELETTLILEDVDAAGWTALLPNTTFGLTSILLSSEYVSSLGGEVTLSVELTSDVNTPFLNDEYYKIPEHEMPTTVPRDNTDDTPPILTFDAYLMAEAPTTPFNFDLCRTTRFNASLTNVLTSPLTYTLLSTPAPLPTPYPHTQVPHLITFTIDLSDLFASQQLSRHDEPYRCINLDWRHTPAEFRESVVISHVSYRGSSKGSFKLRTEGEPELYPSTALPPGSSCDYCLSKGGVWCAGNPNKYDVYFDSNLTGGSYPYQRAQRCCSDVSICEGTLSDCSGDMVKVTDL